MRVGVLSLQGAFREHLGVLDSLGADSCKVTRPEHLENIDSIILPGGESSAMVRIAATTELFPALGEKISAGLPVFGTCAGLILLADRLTDASLDGFDRLGGLDVTVARNAYGRQRESFRAPVQVTGLDGAFDATFIRAPQILDLGTDVDVLSEYADGSRAGAAGKYLGRQLPSGTRCRSEDPRRIPAQPRRDRVKIEP